MPTYQYVCISPECGERFELVQSFTDAAASECPICVGPVRKVFSAVGVVFKGSGFYRTDSRAGGEKSTSSGTVTGSGDKPSSAKTATDTSASSSDSGSTKTSSNGSSNTSSSTKASTAAASA
jgi:putative FmdB family regulatory protein